MDDFFDKFGLSLKLLGSQVIGPDIFQNFQVILYVLRVVRDLGNELLISGKNFTEIFFITVKGLLYF